jgi:alkylated DNA repair dioxygenase AlkB
MLSGMAGSRQLSLLAGGPPSVDARRSVQRDQLDERTWVDLGRGWIRGADTLFDECTTRLDWRQRRRPMFGRLVLEPRLTAPLHADGPGTPPAITRAADTLSAHYDQPLRHVWANWYRSGDDAVAWHSDRVGRTEVDPLVAIVTLAGPRTFSMRPRGGGTVRRWQLHSGDLLVMGGAAQHAWEHAVPRQRGGAARISLTFRAAPG